MDLEGALDELARRDPVVARLVRDHPPPPFGRRRRTSHFAYLVRAIVLQQVSARSAEPVWRRLLALVGGRLTAPAVAALTVDDLRGAGLTGGKAAAVHDLATAVVAGRLPLAAVARRPDDEVVAALTGIRGIGPWTAEMFLLLHLGRLDVWPIGDLAVRRGYARAWSLAAEPTPAALDVVGEAYRPYRSIVAWYCWRAYAPGLTPTDQ